MLDFILLYISGKEDADLGNRIGRRILVKSIKERISQGGSMGRNRLLLGKPVATSKASTAFPKKRCHGTAEGLLLLTLMTISNHHKLVGIF